VRGNLTSVLFVFIPPLINVEIDLSSRISISWCKTKHLTCNSSSYVCSPTEHYVSVSCWLLRMVVAFLSERTMVLVLHKPWQVSGIGFLIQTSELSTRSRRLNDELNLSLKSNEMVGLYSCKSRSIWLWTHRLNLFFAASKWGRLRKLTLFVACVWTIVQCFLLLRPTIA